MYDKNRLLRLISEFIDLDATRRGRAESAYMAVGQWLDSADSPLSVGLPEIFAQGSMALGTTIKPVSHTEFDVDLVLALRLRADTPSDHVMTALVSRLATHGEYHARLKRKTRCVRVSYAGDFHLDVIPALVASDGSLRVCSQQVGAWDVSNPRGYKQWFEARKVGPPNVRARVASIEPLPIAEPSSSKSTLVVATQLWKRARDVHFCGASESPASMLLTTLCASAYSGTHDLLAALGEAAAAAAEIDARWPFVDNPTNPGENLARALHAPNHMQAFTHWINDFRTNLGAIRSASGLPELIPALSSTFGKHEANAAISTIASDINSLRDARTLAFAAGSLAASSQVGSVHVPSQKFHGSTNPP